MKNLLIALTIFFAPVWASAAISLDVHTAGAGSGSVTSFTTPVNVGSGSNQVLIIGVELNSTNNDVTSVTAGGVTATQWVTMATTGALNRLYLYCAANVPAGTPNVVVTTSANENIFVETTSVFGADQTCTSDGTNSGSAASGSSLTVSVTTSTAGDWLFGNWRTAISTPTGGANTTIRGSGGVGMTDSNGPNSPAGTYSQVLTNTSQIQNMVVAALKPAPSVSSFVLWQFFGW